MTLILDSGAVTHLATHRRQAVALIMELSELWPPKVPSVVLVECLQGHPGKDALTNALLKTCDIVEVIPTALARRAAQLRKLAGQGSAVDALVIALAEPDGTVLTSDQKDLSALAQFARNVGVERI